MQTVPILIGVAVIAAVLIGVAFAMRWAEPFLIHGGF